MVLLSRRMAGGWASGEPFTGCQQGLLYARRLSAYTPIMLSYIFTVQNVCVFVCCRREHVPLAHKSPPAQMNAPMCMRVYWNAYFLRCTCVFSFPLNVVALLSNPMTNRSQWHHHAWQWCCVVTVTCDIIGSISYVNVQSLFNFSDVYLSLNHRLPWSPFCSQHHILTPCFHLVLVIVIFFLLCVTLPLRFVSASENPRFV